MDATDLQRYVGATDNDVTFAAECWAEAVQLVTDYCAGFTVPATITDRATLEVGSELFHRRKAPNGVAQFAVMDGAAPVRVARDPMVGAYPILNRYVVGGIA